MNTKQFIYVQTLAREGTFSRAAEVLNISQPSLSQYIIKLEKQLGIPLFKRMNGDVRLTDAGQLFIDTGKQIMNLEHQMEAGLTDLKDCQSGTVKIGISPYRSIHIMPRVLAQFNNVFPNIKPIVIEKFGNDLIDSAYGGEFDLCIIALPVDESVFTAVPFQKEEIVIAVNRSGSLYTRLSKAAVPVENRSFPAVSIDIVNNEPFAVLSKTMLMRTETDRILSAFHVQISEKVEMTSIESLLAAVASGICSAFVPFGVTNDSDENIAFFSIIQETLSRRIAVIYKKDQALSRPMSTLIDILKALDSDI